MREFLEKNYTDEAIETDDLTIKLVIKALLEVSVNVWIVPNLIILIINKVNSALIL